MPDRSYIMPQLQNLPGPGTVICPKYSIKMTNRNVATTALVLDQKH